MTGLFTQPADAVLDDVGAFYTGGVLPWFHSAVRSRTDPHRLAVTLWDPEAATEGGALRVYTLTATDLKNAVREARRRGYRLCCAADVTGEGIGSGCAWDFDVIVQTACYGELVFG
ncbi:hypothetical protein [Granulicoccus phenolivorans]|uniref:hypothetical protein n=1 Tax=Granulicoccus phenolivorans TaxID=266854 RepID=UPI0004040F30|nr:hypothetical protein [Granulicoccus phenolivorans]